MRFYDAFFIPPRCDLGRGVDLNYFTIVSVRINNSECRFLAELRSSWFATILEITDAQILLARVG
jgi:hypothetical protein